MWIFGTHGEFVDRRARTPAPGPGGLAAYDPHGFRLLASIYSGTHAGLAEEDQMIPEGLSGAMPTAVVVSGCGRSEYNGTYTIDGVADGVPCYRKPGTACTMERGPWNGITWGMNKECVRRPPPPSSLQYLARAHRAPILLISPRVIVCMHTRRYGNFDYWLESSAAVPPAAGWQVDNGGAAGGRGVPPAPGVRVLYAADEEGAKDEARHEGRPSQ